MNRPLPQQVKQSIHKMLGQVAKLKTLLHNLTCPHCRARLYLTKKGDLKLAA